MGRMTDALPVHVEAATRKALRPVAANTGQIAQQRGLLNDRRGQYALWAVGSLLLFVLLIGIVIDLGLLLREFRRAQNAFDAAAQAAAQSVDMYFAAQSGQVVLLPEAYDVAQAYGALNARSSVRVTGVEVTPDNQVRVWGIAGLRAPFFLSAFGFGRMVVHVSATARPAFGIAVPVQ